MSTKQTFRQAKTYVASRTFMQTDPVLVTGGYQRGFYPFVNPCFSPHIPLPSPHIPLPTFLSLKNKGFQRHELIELYEQEGAARFFVEILGGFWRLWPPAVPDFHSVAPRPAVILAAPKGAMKKKGAGACLWRPVERQRQRQATGAGRPRGSQTSQRLPAAIRAATPGARCRMVATRSATEGFSASRLDDRAGARRRLPDRRPSRPI